MSVVSDSVRPHRRQPTRIRRPWDSPGKNTGVGCHFLLQCMKVKSESEVTQSCPTQWPHRLKPTRLLHPWDFPGKSTGVGCHCLLWIVYLAKLKKKKKCQGFIKVANKQNHIIRKHNYPFLKTIYHCIKRKEWNQQYLLSKASKLSETYMQPCLHATTY